MEPYTLEITLDRLLEEEIKDYYRSLNNNKLYYVDIITPASVYLYNQFNCVTMNMGVKIDVVNSQTRKKNPFMMIPLNEENRENNILFINHTFLMKPQRTTRENIVIKFKYIYKNDRLTKILEHIKNLNINNTNLFQFIQSIRKISEKCSTRGILQPQCKIYSILAPNSGKFDVVIIE